MCLALFTEPYAFPHPPVDPAVLLILEDAIRAAWKLLVENPPVTLNLAEDLEEPLNFHLHEALTDRVWNRGVVDGFDEMYFRDIQPAPEVCNFDRKELKKRPDMLVKLAGRPETVKPSQDGIFIECKPVDAAHPLVSQYCRRGITRFVVGRYAWAMQEAMMIGYAREDTDASALLHEAFGKTTATHSVGEPERGAIQGSAVTRHRRSFCYTQTGAGAPEITLRHVWLLR